MRIFLSGIGAGSRSPFVWLLKWLGVVATVGVLLTLSAPTMAAQSDQASTATEIPDSMTREQVRDLVARLSDDEVRDLIISQLDKQAVESEPADTAAAYVGQLTTGLKVAGKRLRRMFASGNEVHALPGSIWRQISADGSISGWYLLFQLFGLLLCGWLVERVVTRLLTGFAHNAPSATSLTERAGILCLRAGLGLVEIGAFAAGAALFLSITTNQAEAAALLWGRIIWFIVYARIWLLGIHLVVAPEHPAERLVPVDDRAARGIWRWALAIIFMLVLPLDRVVADYGAARSTVLLVGFFFSSTFIVLLIALVIRLRRYGAQLIAGDQEAESSGVRQGVARVWWVLAIVYILLIWLMAIGKRAATGESSLVPGMGSLVLFAAIPYIDMGLQWIISWYFAKDDQSGSGESSDTADDAADTAQPAEGGDAIDIEPMPPSTPPIEPGYLSLALRYARVLLGLAVLLVFVRLWGIDLESITAHLVGEHFAASLFDISVTVLLAWAVWGVIRIAIERKLDDEQAVSHIGAGGGEGDGGGLGGTRLETVLPIFRIFLKTTLIVMVVLLSLSALGVQIAPLIAGAGVIGIAIGFGAQSLVRDIVSGLFFLIDDAFRVGEYVQIGTTRGTVERISIRSFQLRHHNGPVHTIPYGEINHLTNYSRDWAIMKLELRLPYETDIEKVRKLIKKVGIEMIEDPQFESSMLLPLKSQGVNRMDDSALIIRCKFMAVPGKQFVLRREAFTRIQKVFEENDIHFAPRRVLVESVAPLAPEVAAAASAIDKEGGGKSGPSDQR
jgi:small-conductance mechanosensitive channel